MLLGERGHKRAALDPRVAETVALSGERVPQPLAQPNGVSMRLTMSATVWSQTGTGPIPAVTALRRLCLTGLLC